MVALFYFCKKTNNMDLTFNKNEDYNRQIASDL